MKVSRQSSRLGGFTLVELLVVVLTLAALIALAVAPALARSRVSAETQACRHNLRQLAAAWTLYAADNNGTVVENVQGGEAIAGSGFNTRAAWAFGWVDWTTSPDNTNTLLVASPKYSRLADYQGRDARLFRCPADRYLSSAQMARGWNFRARSYSSPMSIGIGQNLGPLDPMYRQVRSTHDLVHPTPSDTMVFLEEHPDSINDASFASPRSSGFVDVPASFHQGGMNLAMADGAVQSLVWAGSLATEAAQRVRFSFVTPPTTANDPDARLLRYRTPRVSAAY